MPLKDIGEDILLEILSFCDVSAVLSVSTVNKTLRRVALTKQLWLYLLRDLVSRGLLDCHSTEELDAYSTRDIIAEIKHIIYVETERIFDVQLIPGGTHAVLKTAEDVRLYNVHTGRCLWTKASASASISTNLVELGHVARILLVPLEYSANANITIQEINLKTDVSCEVFRVALPPGLGPIHDYWWCTDLREDFFILHVHLFTIPGGDIFVLVDWRTRRQIILNYASADLKPRLLRDHLLVIFPESSPPRQHVLAVTAFNMLEERWESLDLIAITGLFIEQDFRPLALNQQAAGNPTPIAAVAKLEFNNEPICDSSCSFGLSVYENPVHHDAYKIMLYFRSHNVPHSPRNRLLFTYAFSPNLPHATPSLQLMSTFHSVTDVVGPAMSYAGYTVQWPNIIGTIMDLQRERGGTRTQGGSSVLEADPGWERMHFSPLNGAVLGVVDGSVIVRYYQ
ncbi:hypothetical protein DFH07DRAFT_1065505 [Mycena maculata]|uniref:F-box domain-containing protein n=1 Tax=Mycena maculata TaxID=230809 RepID=A0AAD7I1K8_9AGAR|nr:hypothetical protein DFH07DRAFT_1065505 [Mycena maculata]